MRHRSFILLASLLMLLIFGSVAVYAVDASQEDKIAEGVTIAGVDVGGMTRARRATRSPAASRSRSRRPLKGRVRQARSSSSPPSRPTPGRRRRDGRRGGREEPRRQHRLARHPQHHRRQGRRGGPARASLRQARGRPAGQARRAQARARHRRQGRLHGRRAGKVHGQAGISCAPPRCARRSATSWSTRSPERVVEARVSKTRPKVGIDDLAGKYPMVVTVDRASYTLRLYKKLKLQKSYTIAVGQAGLETPAGMYRVQNKAVNPAWSVPNRLGGRPGRPGRSRRRAQQPAEGALARHLQRRRDPRHLASRLAGRRRLARLHPHGGPGRDARSTTRFRSAPRSTSPSRVRASNPRDSGRVGAPEAGQFDSAHSALRQRKNPGHERQVHRAARAMAQVQGG